MESTNKVDIFGIIGTMITGIIMGLAIGIAHSVGFMHLKVGISVAACFVFGVYCYLICSVRRNNTIMMLFMILGTLSLFALTFGVDKGVGIYFISICLGIMFGLGNINVPKTVEA